MFFLASIPHLSTLIAPPFAQLFMNLTQWIPFAVAMTFLAVGVVVIWVMPESLARTHPKVLDSHDDDDAIAPLLVDHAILQSPGLSDGAIPDGHSPHQTTTKKPSVLQDLRHLLLTPTLPFCFAIFALRPFALISRAFIYQHASETFHWPISRTTWLRVAQAAGSSTVTMIILPLISTYLIRQHRRRHRHLTPDGNSHSPTGAPSLPITASLNQSKARDLNTIRASLFIAALGFAILWQASQSWQLIFGLVICGLGEGLEPGLQALATTLVEKAYNARLLTFVAVLEISGKLAGGPIMGSLFSIGRGKQHGSSGFSFAVSAGMFALLGLGSLFVRLKIVR